MPNPAFFSAFAHSRSPRLHIDYDTAAHRYKPSYLKPNGYDIDLNAFPGVEQVSITVTNHVTGKKSKKDSERLIIPPNAISYDWKIEKASTFPQIHGKSDFRAEQSNPIKRGRGVGGVSGTPYKHTFHVPSLGTYTITLQLRLSSSTPLEHKVSFTLHDFLVVSIGESGASGEGNPDEQGKLQDCDFDFSSPLDSFENCTEAISNFVKTEFTTLSVAAEATLNMEKDPVWLEPKAHRSLRSGPARAAKGMENLGKGTMVTFLSFARSGSEIRAGLLGPRTSDGKPIDSWIGNIGQIQELKNTLGDRRINALVIAIGGNDIGFSHVLSGLTGEDLFFKNGDDEAARKAVEAKINKNLAELDTKFKQLAEALAGLNVGQIYLTEYPTGIFDVKTDANGQGVLGKACEIFASSFDADLDSKDLILIRDSAIKLNNHLRKAANDHGWFFIDGIAAGFAGRGYCAENSLFLKAEQSLVIQGDIKGTAHPNPSGHGVYARLIAEAVRNSTITPALKVEQGEFVPVP
jgi:hypothetical protein